MRAIELFAAMQCGNLIDIVCSGLYLYSLRIHGMAAEDGSGACWIVSAYDVHNHENVKLFVHTIDNGGKFSVRHIV
jgi:hypothetical protein